MRDSGQNSTSGRSSSEEVPSSHAIASFEFGSTFLMSSGKESLITQGTRKHFLLESSNSLDSQKIGELFQHVSGSSSMIVGVLPFDRERSPHLFEPARVSALNVADLQPDASRNERFSWHAMHQEPSRQEYAGGVRRVLSCFSEDPKLKKVVLARSLVFRTERRPDIVPVLQNLSEDPHATVFCSPLPGKRSVLVGASPELLIEKKGRLIFSHPLAGSAARSADPETDQRNAEKLLQSEKDLREHIAVVQSIADRLSPYCKTLDIPEKPSLVSTNALWHLGTKIQGELKDRSVSSLELAAVLYPTPAVCGTPRDRAKAIIDELEPFDRGFFAGAVGWCNRSGDGRWFVSIRCAEVSEHQTRLYAGAGIVAGSDPELESQETATKFRTLLDALRFQEKTQEIQRVNL